MESIYIENYVKIPVEEKLDFLQSLEKNCDYEVKNQEVIFSEESVIIDFGEKSDINKAYSNFKQFFRKHKEIKIDKITKMKNKANQIILEFNNSKTQIRV